VDQGPAFNTVPAAVEGFVQPSFEVETWPESASVLVVTAPGAVGKSATAAALAQSLSCPLIRAELAQVGSYSLSGLVQDATGFAGYIADVAQGAAALVVDSLDEALMKVGTQNFIAFLENVFSVAGSSSGARQPSVILFSRPDAAEYVQLVAAEQAAAVASVHLDFFDLDGAHQFIRSYMADRFAQTGRPEYNVQLAAPIPFGRLRDTQFQRIAEVIVRDAVPHVAVRWPDVKDFLGYTPVLAALGEALAVPNPQRAAMDLSTSADPSALLMDICESVLEREAGKFRAQMMAPLRADLPAESAGEVNEQDLYTPLEQILRLIGRIHGLDIAEAPPASLPVELRERYEAATQQFLADHPFMRNGSYGNLVFRDYVFAFAAMDPYVLACLAGNAATVVRDPGPYFAHFVYRLMDGAQDRSLPESIVGSILKSWLRDAELQGQGSTTVKLHITDDRGHVTCHSADESVAYTFSITGLSGAIQLEGPLRSLEVVTDSGVILGTRGGMLSLGPDVVIVADEIHIEADSVDIDCARGDRLGVFLGAESVNAYYLNSLNCPDAYGLTVFTEGTPPPHLRGYARKLGSVRGLVPWQDYVDLRAILLSFKPSVVRGPCVYWEKLDRTVVKDNENRRRILDHLLQEEIVVRDGDLYRVDLSSLGGMGFGLAEIKGGNPGDAVLNFLGELRYGPGSTHT
jgi:hypothetical protein